jgi:hypothetical protein
MSTSFDKRSPAALAGLAIAAALILAACGGGGGNGGSPVANNAPGDAAPIDPFLAAVQGQVSLSGETTTEPINIDAIAVTSSEDKEPIAI